MYYTTYWWFECARNCKRLPKHFAKCLADIRTFPLFVCSFALFGDTRSEISHKIAINHKRLCFIKICVCVYYVFVRYIHVHTSEIWNACRSRVYSLSLFISLSLIRSLEHRKFSVDVYDICRHVTEPNRTRSRIEYEADSVCVCVCVERKFVADEIACNIHAIFCS